MAIKLTLGSRAYPVIEFEEGRKARRRSAG